MRASRGRAGAQREGGSYNRPFDDQSQSRVRLESEAVLTILEWVRDGRMVLMGSSVIRYELGKTTDEERRRAAELLSMGATDSVILSEDIEARGRAIEALGIKALDALHLACAEAGGADFFLTTDAALVQRATAHSAMLSVKVQNPLQWLSENMP